MIRLRPAAITHLRCTSSQREGALAYHHAEAWIDHWVYPQDAISWQVEAAEPGWYELALTYACAEGSAGSTLQIVARDSHVELTTRETRGLWANGWRNFERVPPEGTLYLPEGQSTIILRATHKPAHAEQVLVCYQLDLTPSAARPALGAEAARAHALRADSSWLAEAKYGLMFHWTAETQPWQGPAQPFPQAVRSFDVSAFAAMVEETGAGYVLFTTTHAVHWFPAPLSTIERLLPGRTCDRDLIRDLATALNARGIKLLLYYHPGRGSGDHADAEWLAATGHPDRDPCFYDHWEEILTEIGQRYGQGVAGYWFDYREPDQPFERLYRACKVGNPQRLVAFNSWITPRLTDFQDYWAGELGGSLCHPPTPDYFGPDGPQSGLRPHVLPFLDDPWVHGRPDTPIRPPLFHDEQVTAFVQDWNAIGGAATLNLGIYQDGSIAPATLEQMRALRRAIRGH